MSDAKKIGAALGELALGLGGKKRPAPSTGIKPTDPYRTLQGESKGSGVTRPKRIGLGCSCSRRKEK